ncbi:MAG: hypothetical protein KME11_04780 [Timaviella obliquedivisa GSE-PSE-MK23-08B]|jgi:hypothetical protein|nr:hypothetical protein [Timaviella obliquedivisa GSE-PSE-MK23-08B]
MVARKKLTEILNEVGGEATPCGYLEERAAGVDPVAALPAAVEPESPVIDEVPNGAIVTAEMVRATALSQMPDGSSEMFAILPKLGIEIPQPVVPQGATLEESVAADLMLLNILLAKVVGNLQFQSTLNQALAKVDEVMGDRFSATLYQQRRESESNRFHGAMAALMGGDAKGGFRFSTPSSYVVPQGWEVFVEPEKTAALPEGEN